MFKAPDGKVLLGAAFVPPKNYRKGINQFIDLTENEFENQYLNPYLDEKFFREGKHQINFLNGIFTAFNSIGRFLQEINPLKDVPRKVDWKEKGKVSKVKS